MKVLLIGFFTRTYMPYIEKYEKILIENKIEYDIIYFDRDNDGKSSKQGNSYIFRKRTTANKLRKLIPVLNYRNYIRKIVKEGNYDKLVLLTTMPALLLGNVLLKKYKGNYIFDYRDYTYEKYNFYRKRVDKIIKNSYITLMSSEGYLDYFENKDKILITHNISNCEFKEKDVKDIKGSKNITIGFLGYVRYFDVNSKLIEVLKNDPMYKIAYYGTAFSDCNLEEYCKKNNITNVNFYGKFDNKEKSKIYQKVDMINSIYSLSSPEVRPAIPNRLYDSVLFKKPIIVTEGTFLAKIVEKYKLGILLNLENPKEWKNKIENYIRNYDREEFKQQCEIFLEKVLKDEEKNEQKIKEFFIK